MPQVAIIGGGFAGPVLALCLKKHGITSAIYDVRDQEYKHGGNVALAPNAQRVLDHIGIYDTLRNSGCNYEELYFTNSAGTVLGKFLNGSQKAYNFPALRIHRTVVRDELIAELGRQGIPVHYNKKCIGVKKDTENEVTVSFADGETVVAEFVVGADGIHSRIRPHIAPDCEPRFSGLMGVMATVMADQLKDINMDLHLPCMIFGASGSFAIMPSSFTGDEVGYFATIEATDRSRAGWTALENNKQEMVNMLAERFLTSGTKWPKLVQALCERTPPETLTSWPFFSVPHLDTWSSPTNRVLIIGDSAHAIPPTGGQGSAMAFEDAETLAYVLGRFYARQPPYLAATPPSLATLIHKWEQHRFARVAKVVDFTTKNGTMLKSSNHFYEQAAKEWVIWAGMKWMGEAGGAAWMYGYNAESVLGALA
ncbi:hypothetical protein MMC18_006884 [Xylographa bjoerkii]|nr:hypothetical protein [Xylographa bjoerkii]